MYKIVFRTIVFFIFFSSQCEQCNRISDRANSLTICPVTIIKSYTTDLQDWNLLFFSILSASLFTLIISIYRFWANLKHSLNIRLKISPLIIYYYAVSCHSLNIVYSMRFFLADVFLSHFIPSNAGMPLVDSVARSQCERKKMNGIQDRRCWLIFWRL